MNKLKELGSFADFVRGPFGGSLKKEFFVEDGFAVYEQQHAINNQFERIRYFIDAQKFNEMKRFELKPNDLIMSCSGTMGKVAIVPQNIRKGIINQALLKITPKKELSSRFLELYMQSQSFLEYLNKDAKGVAIKNVASVKELKKIPIPTPPLPIQHQIVEKLDAAFEAIDRAKANLEKNIQNAKELFQSKLNELFSQKGEGWEEKRIKDVALVTAGQSPEGKYYNENGNGMPFYQGKKEFTEKYIGKAKVWTSFITKVAKEGDVLMSVRAPVGPVNFATEKCCIGRGLASIRVKEHYDKDFLYYYFKNIENTLIGNAGAVFNSINKSQIENLNIPLLNISEQQKIVTQLDQLSAQTEALQQKYTQKLQNLEELRKSILEKAFKGELTN